VIFQVKMEDGWKNCGFQIYRSLKRKDGTDPGKPVCISLYWI
jgi:hypothetical protein